MEGRTFEYLPLQFNYITEIQE